MERSLGWTITEPLSGIVHLNDFAILAKFTRRNLLEESSSNGQGIYSTIHPFGGNGIDKTKRMHFKRAVKVVGISCLPWANASIPTIHQEPGDRHPEMNLYAPNCTDLIIWAYTLGDCSHRGKGLLTQSNRKVRYSADSIVRITMQPNQRIGRVNTRC